MVAVDSVVERTVIVRNHLNQHISVAFKVNESTINVLVHIHMYFVRLLDSQ